MPRLMERKDWPSMVSDFGSHIRVWQEDLSGDSNVVPLSLPEQGSYRVFLVKIGEPKKSRRSAREMIGYGRKYGSAPRTAEDWIREIREGDEA